MPAEPWERMASSILFSDQEISRLATNASKAAETALNKLYGKEGSGAAVRRAQLELAKINADMWGSTLGATQIAIGDAVWQATEYQALIDEGMFAKAGISAQYWRHSMTAQAQAGVSALIARKENGITLSQTVYKNTALSKGYVDNVVNNGLLLGKSAREIAQDVRKYIDPAVPGGVSSAALRLGRTEVNNAYHRTTINQFKQTPWVETAVWHLSGSHPEQDECNEYAEQVHFKNGKEGEFQIGDIPAKPHPNCLCYITPETMPIDKYAKAFQQGKFDDYIEDQMGCMGVL